MGRGRAARPDPPELTPAEARALEQITFACRLAHSVTALDTLTTTSPNAAPPNPGDGAGRRLLRAPARRGHGIPSVNGAAQREEARYL